MNYEERCERMADLVDGLPVAENFPLLKVVAISPIWKLRLGVMAHCYLIETIKSFRKCNLDIYKELSRSILSMATELPNLTPNGLVLPKAETLSTYNMLHKTVADFFKSLGLGEHAARIHAPINIRVVNGRRCREFENRPHSSTKLHSDVWAGEPPESVSVFIPIAGDLKDVSIRFMEHSPFPEYLKGPLEDFDDGAFIEFGARPYDYKLRADEVLFSDALLLHQTDVEWDDVTRLSIDFRFVPKRAEFHPNYIPADEWYDIGRGRKLTTDAKLEQHMEIREYKVVKNED